MAATKGTQLRLKPFEWNISSVILWCPERPPAPRPLPAHPPGTGCLATLADWVSRVKKGSGTGRTNQITPIDHLLCALLWELRPRPQNQSPAITSERGLFRTKGAKRHMAGFCVAAQSDVSYCTSPCDAATAHCCKWFDCKEISGTMADRSGEQGCTDKRSVSRKGCALRWPIIRYYEIWGIYLGSLAVIWIDSQVLKGVSSGEGEHSGGLQGGWYYSKCHPQHL